MVKVIDVDFELTAAQAMLAEMDEYLKSDVLFWQVTPNALGDRMPKLTIGGLLEALIRAEAGKAAGIPTMRTRLETVKARQHARYLARAEQETRSRLDAWNWYLSDYHRTPGDVAAYYPNEVRSRLKAELLLAELERERRGGAERLRATASDEMMRAAWRPGIFVWDESLKPFFPPERYWWLYGKLRIAAE
jgi:hypothetical protein